MPESIDNYVRLRKHKGDKTVLISSLAAELSVTSLLAAASLEKLHDTPKFVFEAQDLYKKHFTEEQEAYTLEANRRVGELSEADVLIRSLLAFSSITNDELSSEIAVELARAITEKVA